MNIGILGTADIAFRRFLPALAQCPEVSFAGIASRTPEKAACFAQQFGGTVYPSYDTLLADPGIDAVYVPLPPALHFEWGRKALLAGKHLLMEKPFTTSLEETEELLHLAEERGIAVHENYMFLYHSQLNWLRQELKTGAIGELRLLRAAFGFPFRGTQDFRYDKALGGGALLDCGGYPVRLALELLGPSTRVVASCLRPARGLDVDVYGNATLVNDRGDTAQVSFGMDNSYRCELELWGSTGSLTASRVFTAPPGFAPPVTVVPQSGGAESRTLPEDDAFRNSIRWFLRSVADVDDRAESFRMIRAQSRLIQQIQEENR